MGPAHVGWVGAGVGGKRKEKKERLKGRIRKNIIL